MKWIFAFIFLSWNLFAESKLSELPADVQSEITTTEAAPALVVAETKVKDAATSLEPTVVETKAAAIVDKTTAKESEIPLTLETTKKISSSETTYFRAFMVIALLGILACGTWLFVRKAKSQNIKRNKNEIKILAQHYLGPKKSLAVVRVAGESILVGITEGQINMIKTLSLMDDELPEVTSNNFQSELDVRMNQESKEVPQSSGTYNRKSQINSKSVNVSEDEMDEFSIKGIKDLVSSKLKNMRSI